MPKPVPPSGIPESRWRNCAPTWTPTILKKTAPARKVVPPRQVDYKKPFLKNWTRLERSGRYDLSRLKQAMMLLIANDEPLGAEWREHALKGEWADCRECHIGGDFLLIYRVDECSVSFIRTGSHAELLDL
ncbi:type II toxin-antitoxin system mRNA interferase toxin, RelE/StbE family [Rugamonas sp. FT107W]|uniref:Type II toxin-antitoxin system mRNA interferase toxin, RelE/StbE family n=1 Tax=Duganella vulcania TaxID=2692166 RepID=A0A845HMD2_9BURK|nr:type II toxin-antitoxin system YafQ family toxin [Duganella vulcania]MYN19918.1 type II toxin-antitoxin system mRNA interferase toxin, RelE/StbE family [Duganella vulcania]